MDHASAYARSVTEPEAPTLPFPDDFFDGAEADYTTDSVAVERAVAALDD